MGVMFTEGIVCCTPAMYDIGRDILGDTNIYKGLL